MLPLDRPQDVPKLSQTKPTHVLRTPSASILPLYLQGQVPPCAQQCLATHINEGYNNCPNDGIACLCRSYTTQGFALGELAYLCLSQSCGQPSRSQLLAQYNICSDVSGAVAATHTVLPASGARPPKSSTPDVRESTSTGGSSSSLTRSPLSTSSRTVAVASPHVKNSSSAMGSLTTRGGTTPSSKPAAAADSAPSSTDSSRVNTSEIIGIAVGIVAFIVIVAAAMYFFWCGRRRKNNEGETKKSGFLSSFRRRRSNQEDGEKSYDFVDRGPPRLSPLLNIKPANEIHVTDRDTIGCWQQLASSPAKHHQKFLDRPPPRVKASEAGQTATAPIPQMSSGLSTHQIPSAQSNMADSDEKPVEESRTPTPTPIWNGLGLPPNPRAAQYSPKIHPPAQLPPPATDRTLEPSSTQDWPLLSKDSGPTKQPLLLSPLPPAITILPPQPAADWNYPEPPLSALSKARSRDSSGSLLNYYASSEAGIVSSPAVVESPGLTEYQVSKQPAAAAKKRLSRRDRSPHSRKDSAGSDTEFESSDEDLLDPKDVKDIHLSPAPESTPPIRSPIAGMTYPSIPKSASQGIHRPSYYRAPQTFPQSPTTPKAWNEAPRTPREDTPHQYSQQRLPVAGVAAADRRISDQSILSGSTLVEKRRGRKKAYGLELNLYEDDSAYTPFKQSEIPMSNDNRNGHRTTTHARYYASSPKHGQYMQQSGHRRSKHQSRGRRQQEAVPEGHYAGQSLTPEKRGDDLYLPFGVASPMQAEFR